MKQTNTSLLAPLITALAFAAMPALSLAEENVPLAKVPEKVLAAARAAVPGIKFTEAESEKTAQGVIYELEGKANGKDYNIKVSAEGKVIKVEGGDEKDKKGD